MDCKFRSSLNAFHDGELPDAAALELEQHLKTCRSCSAELAEIRELGRSFDVLARDEMSSRGIARAHTAADAAAWERGSPILRITGILTGLAASVLAIASAWLWEAPASDMRTSQTVVAPMPAPEWERVAMTLDAGPLPGENVDMPGRPVLADARLADWMLENLSR